MSRRQTMCVAGVLAMLVMALTSPVLAQGTGSVRGTVTDALGARIAGAAVTLTDDRGQARDGKSGAEGEYAFDNVMPGRYQVTATMQGFEPFTSAPVYVGAGPAQRID